jgi:hypothetical protein
MNKIEPMMDEYYSVIFHFDKTKFKNYLKIDDHGYLGLSSCKSVGNDPERFRNLIAV